MDLSCIISSGDLELYVLGMLPEEEAAQISQLADLFPEIRQEIDLITESLAGAAAASVAAPSPALKGRIMDRLHALNTGEGGEGSARVVPLQEEPAPGTPVMPLPSGRRNPYYWYAAAVLAIIVCAGFIINLVISNNQARGELASLQRQVDSLRNGMASGEQNLLAYRRTVEMMHSPDYAKINLTQVPGKPAALAQVFWNKKTGDVYLSDVSLPGAPSGRQYQLWAIVDGKPVDAGLLGQDKQVAQKMKPFPSAQMFAITLERAGGSPTPTMKEMYVMGKV